MQLIIHVIFLLSSIFIIQSYSVTLNSVGKCLSDLATQEFSNSYNYLQLSSRFGTKDAYPGFSSLFIKLSDDDASKAHDITKFLALRKIKLDRLVNINGVRIRTKTSEIFDVNDTLTEARDQNKETWKIVQRCHQEAANVKDANIQDYLESNLLNHHIKIDKLFSDFQHRITDSQKFDKELTIFLLDEELLHTYGDRRKDIFS
jgi:ferritin